MKRQAMEAFIADIIAVYAKHGLCISHEDGHGALLIERLDKMHIEWLRNAVEHTESYKLVEEKLKPTEKRTCPDCGNCILANECTYYGFQSDSCGYSARV